MKCLTHILIIKFLFVTNLCFGQWQSLDQGLEGPGGYTLLYDSTESLLYVAGYFDYTGDGLEVNSITKWDGIKWDSLAGGIPGGFGAEAMDIYQGKLYVSGCCFSYTSSINSNYLGYWDGSNWDTLNERINGPIEVMKEHNNELYLGGAFYRIGNVESHLLTKLNGNNYIIIPFGADADGSRVRAIEFYQGKMYVGGNFYDTITGVNDLEVWDGVSFQPFGGNGLNFGGSNVQAMLVHNNELYIAGGFDYVNGIDTFHSIMKWDGSQMHDVGGGTLSQIQKMKVYNGVIYVSGFFTSIGNVPIHISMAKWDGNSWSEVFPDTLDGLVHNFLFVNNDLYIAGGFTHINGQPFNHIARYPGFVGVKDINKDLFDIQFKNPVTGQLYAEFSTNCLGEYEIVTQLGQVILSGEINSSELSVDLNKLTTGMYFLKAGCNGSSVVRKMFLIN